MRRSFVVAVWVALAALAVAGCAGRQPTPQEERALLDERSPYAFHRALTYTLVKTGQFKKALLHARRLPLLRDDDPEAFYLLGRVYAGLSLNEAAVENLERALRLRPRYLAAITMLGVVHDALGHHPVAQRYHRRALALSKDNPILLNNLGFSLYLDGKLEPALATYQRALRYDVGSRRLHNNIGFAYGRLGRDAEAEKHFRLAGRPAEAMNNLGLVRESRGELAAARDYFLAALEADPALEVSRANLVRVARALGEPLPAAAASAPAASVSTQVATPAPITPAPTAPALQGGRR